MRTKGISIRGALIRDTMKNMMESAMGHPFQTGEYRKNPVEPAWICPGSYEYEIIEMPEFKMEYLRPAKVSTERVILQLHGGGYIGPMKNTYRDFAVRYSRLSLGSDVLTIDYRVAPEHPFPAAVEDAVTAYRWLTEEKNYDPNKIVIVGDSAGGGLTLALVLYLRDHNMPLPTGLITMSPWTDMTCSGESHITNYTKDPQFGNTKDNMLYNSSYAGDADPTDPYMSPLFGSYEKIPPILMQVGSYEVLLDDTLRVADKIRACHGKLRVSVYEGMFHVFQMAMNLIPESKEAWEEVAAFLHIIYGIDRRPDGKVVKRVKSGRGSKQ
ncbi:MAG: alpha/beta hydrolase [Lachnospiraceae bacterium]